MRRFLLVSFCALLVGVTVAIAAGAVMAAMGWLNSGTAAGLLVLACLTAGALVVGLGVD